jgi:enoyl-CoA hydratase
MGPHAGSVVAFVPLGRDHMSSAHEVCATTTAVAREACEPPPRIQNFCGYSVPSRRHLRPAPAAGQPVPVEELKEPNHGEASSMIHGHDTRPASTDAGEEPVVLVESRDQVLIVTLNRPRSRNAINLAVAEEVAAAMDALDNDPRVRTGVLAGAGGTFCAGMDLKAFAAGESPFIPGRGFAGLVESPPRKPLIAAVEGWALAGGFELVLACDLIVAARDAVFGIPEVKRGLVAAGGALIRLPRRIPYHHAMALALTGDPIDAVRAAELGGGDLARRARAGAGGGVGAGRAAGPQCTAVTRRLQADRRCDTRLDRGRGVAAPV